LLRLTAGVLKVKSGFARLFTQDGAVFWLTSQGSFKSTVLLAQNPLNAVSPGLLRKLFWRVTFVSETKVTKNS